MRLFQCVTHRTVMNERVMQEYFFTVSQVLLLIAYCFFRHVVWRIFEKPINWKMLHCTKTFPMLFLWFYLSNGSWFSMLCRFNGMDCLLLLNYEQRKRSFRCQYWWQDCVIVSIGSISNTRPTVAIQWRVRQHGLWTLHGSPLPHRNITLVLISLSVVRWLSAFTLALRPLAHL